MITLKLKNIDGLKSKEGDKNLLIQCSFCPTWNLKQEDIDKVANDLSAEVKKIGTLCNRPKIEVNPSEYDAVFVLGCGAGVQIVAEELNCSVIPVADTTGVGVKDNDEIKIYCKACGNCILDSTGGICPITRCAKSLLNGPCGGVHDGLCEVEGHGKCGWILIIERMKELDRLDEVMQPRLPKLDR